MSDHITDNARGGSRAIAERLLESEHGRDLIRRGAMRQDGTGGARDPQLHGRVRNGRDDWRDHPKTPTGSDWALVAYLAALVVCALDW